MPGINDVIALQGDREVTVLDRCVEMLRLGNYLNDCAARCGVSQATLHRWIRDGTRLSHDLLAGRRTNADLTVDERDLVRFAAAINEAEADGKHLLLQVAHRLSVGGQEIVEETVIESPAIEPLFDSEGHIVRTGREAHVERKRTTKTAQPDGVMIRWRLATRWPNDFGRINRLEVSGAEGGPIHIELTPPVERLLTTLDRIASASNGVIDVAEASERDAVGSGNHHEGGEDQEEQDIGEGHGGPVPNGSGP